MPNVAVYNMQREKVGEHELPDAIFADDSYAHLLHEVVRYQRAKARSGTACTRERSDVSGGGAKPYRQKGTGRARQGTRRAPQFRGGGVVFGPRPRDYSFKLNKKVRRNALKSALTQCVADEKLVLVDELVMPEIKTRHFADFLARFGVESAVVVTPTDDEAVKLSARNIPRITVLPSTGLNVMDVLGHDHLIITVGAVDAVKERLS